MPDLKAARAALPNWPLWTLPVAFLAIAVGALVGGTAFAVLAKAIAGRIRERLEALAAPNTKVG